MSHPNPFLSPFLKKKKKKGRRVEGKGRRRGEGRGMVTLFHCLNILKIK